VADVWAPDAIEDLSVRPYCCDRHVVAPKPRLAVRDVRVEYLTAQSSVRRAAHTPQVSVVKELLLEREGAQPYVVFDYFEALSGSTKVGF
jgi:hypothetical protein